MKQTIVVTGTDTNVGKTVFAAGLAAALDGYYWKPVQAGTENGTDSEAVARLSGLPADRILPEAYRLHTPCSPHEAAALDGVVIEPAGLRIPHVDRPLVIEGAGGALVPLSTSLLYADMFGRWGEPIVIVARTSLGTINHSLLTIETLRERNLLVHGIAFVGEANAATESVICDMGDIRHLGRLDRIEPLTRETLAEAFARAFDPADFIT